MAEATVTALIVTTLSTCEGGGAFLIPHQAAISYPQRLTNWGKISSDKYNWHPWSLPRLCVLVYFFMVGWPEYTGREFLWYHIVVVALVLPNVPAKTRTFSLFWKWGERERECLASRKALMPMTWLPRAFSRYQSVGFSYPPPKTRNLEISNLSDFFFLAVLSETSSPHTLSFVMTSKSLSKSNSRG